MNQDTVELLKECNSGIKMAVGSIDDVLQSTQNNQLRQVLSECKRTHQALGSRTHELLNKVDAGGKGVNPVARAMSWTKANLMLSMNPDDHTVADLIVDGCNMGVKSLSRYCNRYPKADEQAKLIASQLIRSEQQLSADLRPYL